MTNCHVPPYGTASINITCVIISLLHGVYTYVQDFGLVLYIQPKSNQKTIQEYFLHVKNKVAAGSTRGCNFVSGPTRTQNTGFIP